MIPFLQPIIDVVYKKLDKNVLSDTRNRLDAVEDPLGSVEGRLGSGGSFAFMAGS